MSALTRPGERVLYGLPVDAMTMTDVLNTCQTSIDTRKRTLIGVVNAAKIVKLHQDDLLRDSLLECDIVVADGQSVVWASKLLRRPLPERVAGIDLFENLLQIASDQSRSVFLVGAKPEVLAKLVEHIHDQYPGVRIAGARDGYYPESESAQLADEIAASGADMLFLGMTSPKKEIFLGRYGERLGVPVLHGVGGSFDVLAGITKRAPLRWQRLGLEWLYRLLQEPRRLARRYVTTNVQFVLLTARELIRPTPRLQAG